MDTPYQPTETAQGDPAPIPGPQSTKKVGTFKASKMIVMASLTLLKQDKEMMLFPVLSIISSLIAVVAIGFLYLVVVAGGSMENLQALAGAQEAQRVTGAIDFAFVFLCYIILYAIAFYFQAGVMAIAHGRISGADLTFWDGMRAASAHGSKILMWAMVSATVGVLLNAIAERSKLLGRIVVALLGAAWSILTYFVLPAIILEDASVKDSLRRSAETIKRTWGETAIVNVGVGLFMMVLLLLGVGVFMGALILFHSSVMLPALVLLVLYTLGLCLVSSTLSIIFRVVLYEYATKGTLPEAFPREIIEYAFKTT